MAITAKKIKEDMTANSRMKLYQLTLDASSTTVTIVPGKGYIYPVGTYSSYVNTNGSFAFTVVAGGGGGGQLTNIMFWGQ